MNLTVEQERAIQRGQAVRVTIAGADCVLVRKDVFDRDTELDYGPWTADETNLLAAETADLLAGDGFDEPDLRMNIERGDVLKARFPHASGGRGKKRPVVVVQADVYNQRLARAIVAQVTTNLAEKGDPAFLFVEAAAPENKVTGLDRDCLIGGPLLNVMTEDRLTEKIGKLPPELLAALDGCLRAALGIS